jgi:hypothetical protein
MIRIMKRRRDGSGDAGRPRPKKFRTRYWRYFHSVSFLRWTVYVTSYVYNLLCGFSSITMSFRCALLILASSYSYHEIIVKYRGDATNSTLSAIWKMGFGSLRPESEGSLFPLWCYIYSTWNDFYKCSQHSVGISNVLIASLPQLVISTLYIAINHQLTVMVHLRDWTRLAVSRQPLRVSHPEPNSVQISTYWLSLPYRYSLSLLMSSIVLGWLVSQALFSYRFMYYDNGTLYELPAESAWFADPKYRGTKQALVQRGIGYSAIGVVFSVIVGVVVFVISLALGMKKCVPGLPLGPTNSLVIAAACHPPQSDRNAARKAVQWGVVQSRNDTNTVDTVFHCTITSQKVADPEEGRLYS